MQDEVLHAVHDAMNENQVSAEAAAPAVEAASTDKANQIQVIETTVELDRVAIYLKGPTAFSA
ncbi:hypothetical protein [Microvirga sp. P5_D2]